MKSIKKQVETLFQGVFRELGLDPRFAEIGPSMRPELGDYQCNGALALGKQLGQAPAVVAETIINALKTHPQTTEWIASLTVAMPGFINIRLNPQAVATYLRSMAQSPTLGYEKATALPRVIFDFGGPNLAKEMHVGHLRSAIIGDCLQRLFRFVGYDVISDVHLGDWGMPMGMLICEFQRQQPHLPYFQADPQTDYPTEPPLSLEDLSAMYPKAVTYCQEVEGAREEARQATFDLQQGRPGYRALWQHFRQLSITSAQHIFAALGVTFDWWLGESDAHPTLERLLKEWRQHGQLQESEGAQIIPLATEADNKPMPPLIVVNSDGGVSYGATDLATLEDRLHQHQAKQVFYVVDKRQSLHFEQVFRAARLLKMADDDVVLEHIGFGTINGADGKPFKTRSGGVMRLQDLLELAISRAQEILPTPEEEPTTSPEGLQKLAHQIAISAIKYNDLKNNRTSDYAFDLDSFMTFEGKTGPYLQYAMARMNAILRKAREETTAPLTLQEPSEQELGLALTRFGEVIDRALQKRDPSILADYAYTLAQIFSTFYTACPVLNHPDTHVRAARLSLIQLTRQVLGQVLSLLGIESPAVMLKRKA